MNHFLLLSALFLLIQSDTEGFHFLPAALVSSVLRPKSRSRISTEHSHILYAKGFASNKKSGGGFGSKVTQKKPQQPSKQAVLKRLQNTYGGTSPQEIAQATQRRVEQAIKDLPPHLNIAVQLYRQIKQWDAHVARLSILQQTTLSEQDVQGAQRAKAELAKLMEENGLSNEDIHNILQRATWDASADAKAARSLTGSMPKEIVDRVDRACTILAEALQSDKSKCLDVGCGYGVLVPHLIRAGIKRDQIFGVDLSAEMVRNAHELHPGINFQATNFMTDFDGTGFDGIIFCSALHDFPDPMTAINKAASLLNKNGVLVIVHPQGGSHVTNQALANPVLVRRGLPDAQELGGLESIGLQLIVEPADEGSIEDNEVGYLAVLRKCIQ